MSYCRKNDNSDVYMFESITKVIECCFCLLSEMDDPIFKKRSEAVVHLQKHKEAGHKVPEYAFDELNYDMGKKGDIVE